MKAYKILRRTPTGLVDTYSAQLRYGVGEVTIDPHTHGLSASRTPSMARSHRVPLGSAGLDLPAVLVEVRLDENAVTAITPHKILCRSLWVVREIEDLPAAVVQCGLSPYRLRDAEGWLRDGWGGFRVVDRITRCSPHPSSIPPLDRPSHIIECRPARSGRWAKSVSYRAVPLESPVLGSAT